MARSKCIAVLFASAIAVLGCGDDGNGSGGSGGSAGSGGSGGSAGSGGSGGSAGSGGSGGGAQMACNNESDQQATIGNAEYAAEFWACYDAADTDVEASVDSCMQEALGVSGNCSDCFGSFAGCIDSSCGDVCNERGANTLPCQNCVFDACNLDFNLCSGIAAPSAQPQSTG